MEPIFFQDQFEFRAWLEENHLKCTEQLVGFYKIKSGKQNMTWSQSVDQALCYGWIDGVTRKIDDERYMIRFTPRRSNSIWSNVNIKKVEILTKEGLMKPAGLAAFQNRTSDKSGIYSFEKPLINLEANYIELFQYEQIAWDFFSSLAPSYRKLAIHHIMSAKLESTRQKRLKDIIDKCSRQEKFYE